MKRFLSICLVLTLVLAVFPTGTIAAGTAPFSDVKEGDYFANHASTLDKLGILQGYPFLMM